MKWLIIIFFLCLSCTKKELENERNHLNQVSGPYSHLDPQVATGLAANLIMAKSYESLYEVNPYHAPFDLLPLLASELPEISKDGLVYKIKIRKNVKYHAHKCLREDRVVTANDFVTTFKRISDPKLLSPHYTYFSKYINGLDKWYEEQKGKNVTQYDVELNGVKAIGDHILQITLRSPSIDFVHILTSVNTTPIPLELIKCLENDLSRNMVGTGPFVLHKEIPNHKLEFKKFKNYREVVFPTRAHEKYKKIIEDNKGKQLPLIDSITTHISKEAQTSWLNFLKGNIDYLEVEKDNHNDVFNGHMITKDMKDKGFRVGIDRGDGNLYYFGLNNKNNLLRHKDVRKAIALAIDHERFNDLFFNGQGVVAKSFLPPKVPGNESVLDGHFEAKDIKRAKELLKPYANELKPISILVKNKTVSRQVGEFLKNELASVGIQANVETVSFPNLLKRANAGKFDIFYLSWYVGLPKGLEFFELIYGGNYPGSYNRVGFQNTEFDKLFERAKKSLSLKKQSELVEELNRIAVVELPLIPLLHARTSFIHHVSLKNYVPSGQMGGLEKYFSIQR